jgi:CRP/FNR family transcriptional regulator, anaerobic regulatory protein
MSTPASIIFSHDRCGDCPIRQRAVCAKCDDAELSVLETMKTYRSFAAGQTIAWAGDELDFVASMVTGVATLTRTLEDGRTQMVGLLLPSDFLGRPGRAKVTYTVTAVTDVLMCCFRRKPFAEMLQKMPHVSIQLLEMTMDELQAAREWMVLLGRKTAREKIASLLVIQARREAALTMNIPTGRLELDLVLTREAMADYLGLTLETVSRQFSALRRDGIIMLDSTRHVVVPDFARLLTAAHDDAGS